MSNEVAVRVENLSKVYRIGVAEQRHETLLGALAAVIRSPLNNYRGLRKLSHFDDVSRHETLREGASKGKLTGSRSLNGNAMAVRDQGSSDVLWALQDVSFEVRHGEVLGIIGRNGAGKSTLLKILSQITEPTRGRVEIYGRVGSLLEVGTGFHPDLTGRENIYLNGTILGMRKREVDSKLDEIIEFSGVERFIDTPVKRYSSGMRVRLAFSVAAHLEPEVLIVDEVLAVGDAEFQKKCLGKMEDVATHGRTVLFVSHNMEAVLTLCDRCIVLGGGVVERRGETLECVQHYQCGGAPVRNSWPAHVVWQGGNGATAKGAAIGRIEVLDLEGCPKGVIQTWDDIRIRVHYWAPETIVGGSVILELRDYRGTRLMVMDSGLHVRVEGGGHFIDCVIRCFPLAAGEYTLGAGLALTNSGWLWRKEDLGEIRVNGSDVFGIGRPPVQSRMLFAVRQEWTNSEEAEEHGCVDCNS